MRLWNALRSRLQSLFFRTRREADLREELQFHLERETERLQAGGLSPDAARRQALVMFGGVAPIAEECREARGTGLIDDTIRDIRYALRGFRRAPLASVTIVCTVALGLGLVAVAFTVLNALLFRVDGVPDVHEMFAVRPEAADGVRQEFTRAELDGLRRDTDIFIDAYGEQAQVGSRVDGRVMFGTFVTGNFFQVLGVRPARGRPLTSEDDQPGAAQPVMVLSHRGWERLFARDPTVLGRQLLVNGVSFEIVGVMPENFRGLTLTPDDYWAPFSTLGAVRKRPLEGEAAAALAIVGRLKSGVSRQAAVARLQAWDLGRPGRSRMDSGTSRLTLVQRRGTVERPLEAVPVAAPLFFAFGLILFIGCANVANLLLARGLARQREIGLQLSLGATRRRIVRQLLTESLLLSLVAAAGGFALSRVVLAVTINAVMSAMPPDIGDIRLLVPTADWRVLLFLIVGAGAATIAFALAPALQATTVEPIRTIRGEVVSETRPRRARDVLIALQVSASALLLISAGVFLRSAMSSAAFDSGIRTSDTVAIEVSDEPRRKAIVQAVTAEPSVSAIAAWWLDPVPRSASGPGTDASEKIAYTFVSPEFFSVLEIPVIRGRTFTSVERSPESADRRRLGDHGTGVVAGCGSRWSGTHSRSNHRCWCRCATTRVAHAHCRGRRSGRCRVPCHPLQQGGGLRAGEYRDGLDLARRPRAWRSRDGPAGAPRPLGRDRSEPGPRDRDHAHAGPHGHDLSAAGLLAHDRSRWTGAGPHAVRALQRAVLRRRAANERDRRPDGAWCDHT